MGTTQVRAQSSRRARTTTAPVAVTERPGVGTERDRTPDGRSDWIDVVRGLAVVLVVLYHSVVGLGVAHLSAPTWVTAINDALSPLRMPILMFVSGMLLPRSLTKPARVYLTGKFRAIAWPWLVWTTVTLAILFGGSQLAGAGHFGPSRLLATLVDPRTFTWYLAYLTVYYLIALVLPAFARSWAVPVLLLISGLAADGDGWSRFCFLLAFFFLGDWAARHRDLGRHVRRFGVRLVAALAALALAVGSALGLGLRYQPIAAVGVVGALIVLAPLAAAVAGRGPGRWAAAVGQQSIVYYVTHWPIVMIGAHLLGLAGGRQGDPAAGGVGVALLIMIGLAGSWVAVRARRRFAVVAALYRFPSVYHPSTVRSGVSTGWSRTR